MSEATVSSIIENAISIANNQNSNINAWCSASWMVTTPGKGFYPPQQFNGSVGAVDLSSIYNAVNGVEKLPELQFPGTITIPNWKNPAGTANEDGIFDIINDLNQTVVTYSIDAIGPKLQALFTTFVTSYFPGFPPPEIGLAELQELLGNKGFVTPLPAEDAAFQRMRDRLIADGRRVEEEIVGDWAARGFAMPTGAVQYASYMAKQNTQDKIASAASDYLVEQVKIAADLYKFGIGQAIDYRMKAVNAAVDYLKLFTETVMRQGGADAYAGILNARTKLYDTSVDLYKTMMGIRELRARLSTSDRALDEQYWQQYEGMRVEIAKQQSQAAASAANAVGHAAAAALSSINAMASLANITSS